MIKLLYILAKKKKSLTPRPPHPPKSAPDRELYYNTVLSNSNNTKKMWDNINFIINTKRPSSRIEEISVNNKKYIINPPLFLII